MLDLGIALAHGGTAFMEVPMPRHATIKSTGAYLPPIEISNETLTRELLELNGGNPIITDVMQKLELSSGIKKRWYAPEDQCTSDIALPAARQALERAGLKPTDVDLIILGTDSPDYISPATSTILQYKLGATNAGSFDVGCACASFPAALQAGAGILTTNESINVVLCLGVYNMHKLTAKNDPMRILFGDGAGAAVLVPSSKPGFVSGVFKADGSYADRLGMFSGGTVEPATEESVRAGRCRVQAPGKYPPEMNIEFWPMMVRELARRGKFQVSDIDLAIFTQVRKPTIEDVMKDLGLPIEKTHMIMEESGYTGSACVPMAFDAAVQAGKAKPGSDQLVVMVSSGVGYNLAGCAFRMAQPA